MRLTHAVSIGGKLALVVGFVCLNLVFGNSLIYYYGYNSATFGAQQSVDPFASQNVSYAAPFLMVSQTQSTSNSNSTGSGTSSAPGLLTSGFGLLANVYGYSAPATGTQAPTYSPQTLMWSPTGFGSSTGSSTVPNSSSSTVPSSGLLWMPTASGSTGGSSSRVGSAPATSGAGQSSGLLYWSPSAGSGNPSVLGSSQPPASSNALLNWGAVSGTVIPSVTPILHIPGATLFLGSPVVSPARLPTVNAQAVPEPSTWLTISAGLVFLAFRLRKR